MAANTPRLVLQPLKAVASYGHPVVSKYLRDRGPHLAAMVAYYALLSLVPLLVLILMYCTGRELVRLIGRDRVMRIFFGPTPLPEL